MEVLVTDAKGLPEGCVLSIRAGNTRRQAPLPLNEPFRFPNLPLNAKNFKVLEKPEFVSKIIADICPNSR